MHACTHVAIIETRKLGVFEAGLEASLTLLQIRQVVGRRARFLPSVLVCLDQDERASVRACMRACVQTCVRACVRAWEPAFLHVLKVSHVCMSGNGLPHFCPQVHVCMRRPCTGTFVYTLAYVHADLMMRLEVLQRLHLSICVTS